MRLLLTALLLSSFAYAQEVNEEIQVILREVRVHVQDKDGNPIKGLKLEDFSLSESDKAQNLTFFQEVDYTKPNGLTDAQGNTSELPKRTSILLLDTADMHSSDFEKAVAAAKEFVQNDLTENDIVKIVQLETSAKDLSPFTSDKAKLLAALDSMEHKGTLNRELFILESEIADELPGFKGLVDRVRELEEAIAVSSQTARMNLRTQLSAAERDRDIRAQNIDRAVEEKERAKARHFRNFYLNTRYLSQMLAPMSGPKSILLVSGGIYLEGDSNFINSDEQSRALGSVLNTNKVTMYSVWVPTRKSPAEARLRTSSVPIPADTFRGLYSLRAEYTKTGGSVKVTANSVLENEIQNVTGIERMADVTGGSFNRAKSTGFADALSKTNQAASHFYTLGYQIDASEEGRADRISITTTKDGAKLIYGKKLGDEIKYADMEPDEKAISFKSGLVFANAMRDDFGGDWSYYLFKDGKGGFTTAVTGRLEQMSEEMLQYDFGFTVLDSERIPLDYSFASIPEVPEGDYVSFYDVLVSEKRPAFVRLAVRNLESDGYSVTEFEVAPREEAYDDVSISDIMFAQPGNRPPMPLHILRARENQPSASAPAEDDGKKKKKKKKKKKRGKKAAEPTEKVAKADRKDRSEPSEDDVDRVGLDPFTIGDQLYPPSAAPIFEANSGNIDFYFHLENFTGDDKALKYSVVLVNDQNQGGPVKWGLRNVKRGPDGKGLRILATMTPENVMPGDYGLYLRMLDTSTNTEYRHIGRLVFE